MGQLIEVHITSEYSNKILPINKQVRFPSGKGSLLYIIRNSIPYLNRSFRKLSKIMEREDQNGYLQLSQVLKLVNYTSNLEIIFNTSET